MIEIKQNIKSYHHSLISSIAFISIELAREVNSKAGFYTSEAIRKSMKSKTHHFYKVSHHKVAFGKNRTSILGTMERKTGDIVNPGSLSNFIGWFNMEKNLLRPVTVVAGSHPTYRPILRKDGKKIGYGNTQKGVGLATLSLIHRIDKGTYDADYLKYFGENRTIKNPKAYNFIDEGYRQSMPKITSTIEKEWSRSMGVAVNRTKLVEVTV